MMLHIPLRAKLVSDEHTARLAGRRLMAAKRMPFGTRLLDVPQPKLPPLPRRCYGRSPGRQSKNV